MPTRLAFKQCLCNVCTEKGGTDGDGKPKGMLMEAHLLPAHLKHLQDEQTANHTSNHWTHSSSTYSQSNARTFSSAVDSIAGHLSAITLADDGPNTNYIPNNL